MPEGFAADTGVLTGVQGPRYPRELGCGSDAHVIHGRLRGNANAWGDGQDKLAGAFEGGALARAGWNGSSEAARRNRDDRTQTASLRAYGESSARRP